MVQKSPDNSLAHQPSFLQSLICCIGILVLISAGLFVFALSLHVVMLLAIIWVAAHAHSVGYSFPDIRRMMNEGIFSALPAVYIFILIGMVIASFMQSGTVASLIYYGLELLSPALFLVAGLLLCSFMSLATGTAWGTAGTIGVVLMGIGAAMQIPLPLVAGMVVAGATFGDKLSPVSDTTNLAAMSAGTDLYRHIRSMLYTTGPTYLLVLVILGFIGQEYADTSVPDQDILAVQTALSGAFDLNPLLTLSPLLVLLGMGVLRFSPEVTMIASIFCAVVVAIAVQDVRFVTAMNALWSNSPGTTGDDNLDTMLGRGGMLSMAWTLLLSLMALAMGGILSASGFLRVLLQRSIARLKNVTALVAATIASGIAGNCAMGEAYISIILNCQLFRQSYDRHKIDKAVLSRSVEEGATLSTGLIPWTTAGAFYAVTLGVPTLEYAPYAFLNYLNPFVSVAMASVGWGLFRIGSRKDGELVD